MSPVLDFLQQQQFSEFQKRAAWSKARIIPGYDTSIIRMDICGAWIRWIDYGNTDSEWGWEVDHIYPASLGGTDHTNNLQALQWENNRAKGDSTDGFVCAVK